MGASMLHGDTDIMEPNDSSAPAEHGNTEEPAALLDQDMDDPDFEDEMACINFCFFNRSTGVYVRSRRLDSFTRVRQ